MSVKRNDSTFLGHQQFPPLYLALFNILFAPFRPWVREYQFRTVNTDTDHHGIANSWDSTHEPATSNFEYTAAAIVRPLAADRTPRFV
jgi:hypothetical protein